MNLEYETIACGLQSLIPGVGPVKMIDRLKLLLLSPIRPKKQQKPINIGLFDETSRNQLELF